MNYAPFSKVALAASLTELAKTSPDHPDCFKLICPNWLVWSRGILGTQRVLALPGRYPSFCTGL